MHHTAILLLLILALAYPKTRGILKASLWPLAASLIAVLFVIGARQR
jgi:hypothetical protein